MITFLSVRILPLSPITKSSPAKDCRYTNMRLSNTMDNYLHPNFRILINPKLLCETWLEESNKNVSTLPGRNTLDRHGASYVKGAGSLKQECNF